MAASSSSSPNIGPVNVYIQREQPMSLEEAVKRNTLAKEAGLETLSQLGEFPELFRRDFLDELEGTFKPVVYNKNEPIEAYQLTDDDYKNIEKGHRVLMTGPEHQNLKLVVDGTAYFGRPDDPNNKGGLLNSTKVLDGTLRGDLNLNRLLSLKDVVIRIQRSKQRLKDDKLPARKVTDKWDEYYEVKNPKQKINEDGVITKPIFIRWKKRMRRDESYNQNKKFIGDWNSQGIITINPALDNRKDLARSSENPLRLVLTDAALFTTKISKTVDAKGKPIYEDHEGPPYNPIEYLNGFHCEECNFSQYRKPTATDEIKYGSGKLAFALKDLQSVARDGQLNLICANARRKEKRRTMDEGEMEAKSTRGSEILKEIFADEVLWELKNCKFQTTKGTSKRILLSESHPQVVIKISNYSDALQDEYELNQIREKRITAGKTFNFPALKSTPEEMREAYGNKDYLYRMSFHVLAYYFGMYKLFIGVQRQRQYRIDTGHQWPLQQTTVDEAKRLNKPTVVYHTIALQQRLSIFKGCRRWNPDFCPVYYSLSQHDTHLVMHAYGFMFHARMYYKDCHSGNIGWGFTKRNPLYPNEEILQFMMIDYGGRFFYDDKGKLKKGNQWDENGELITEQQKKDGNFKRLRKNNPELQTDNNNFYQDEKRFELLLTHRGIDFPRFRLYVESNAFEFFGAPILRRTGIKGFRVLLYLL